MTLKTNLLAAISEPVELRKLLKERTIVEKLELIGIAVQIYELHSPGPEAKKKTGLGVTLCGRARSMRHSTVTCKKCLAKISLLETAQAVDDTAVNKFSQRISGRIF